MRKQCCDPVMGISASGARRAHGTVQRIVRVKGVTCVGRQEIREDPVTLAGLGLGKRCWHELSFTVYVARQK